MFGSWATQWFQYTASGLVDALWGSIWHWGAGIAIIILATAAAILSPVGKQFFAAVAAGMFVLLVAYGAGQRDEARICEAKVKVLYLKAHPLITSKNIAKNWRVSPSWDPSKPPNYRPLKVRPNNCYMGFGC